MKELSPEKKLRLEKLELLTYEVEVGNTHRVRKVKGTMLNSAFLLGELSDSRRTMIVRQVENERKPVRVESKDFEGVLINILIGYIQSKRCKLPFNEAFVNILIGYIQSKRCKLPFNEAFACKRLSLKSWPKAYIDGFIPNDFHVKREYLDEIARMVSIHVTANGLTLSHSEAA